MFEDECLNDQISIFEYVEFKTRVSCDDFAPTEFYSKRAKLPRGISMRFMQFATWAGDYDKIIFANWQHTDNRYQYVVPVLFKSSPLPPFPQARLHVV